MHGLYIGSMGMMSNQLKINTHANNITNANTDGYKFDRMISEVFEVKDAYREQGNRTFIGDYQNKVIEQGTVINLKEGNFKAANSDLSMTLKDTDEGTSFFKVSGEQGEYLTRNGDFHLNENRDLKSYSGYYVMDINNNRINIPEEVKYTIEENGEIRELGSGNLIAQIQLKTVSDENKYMLEKAPAGLFELNGMDIEGLPNSTALITTNALESSNVNMTNEMVEMMNAQRGFQASQKIMMAFDKVYETEANELLK